MLHGVKKSDRLERTIDGILFNADEMQDFLRSVLNEYFKIKKYTEEDLKYTWELKEDMV